MTGTAGAKTCLVKFSSSQGTTGTSMSSSIALGATTVGVQHILTVWASAVNSETSFAGTAFINSTVALATSGVDFTNGGWINLTGTLGSGSDHMRVYGYTVLIESQN